MKHELAEILTPLLLSAKSYELDGSEISWNELLDFVTPHVCAEDELPAYHYTIDDDMILRIEKGKAV